MWTIKALSQASGIHLETIRFYEKSQMITPAQRAPNGYRLFHQKHLEELLFIKTCRSLGFDLNEIKILLSLKANPNKDCYEANALAKKQLAFIDQKIQELQTIRNQLQTMVTCHHHTVQECKVINTIQSSLSVSDT